MVEGIDIVQVDVAFLTFNPKHNSKKPSVKVDSTCIAGLYELKTHRDLKRRQKYEMGADAYKHYKWYNFMLRTELNTASPKAKLKIIHWHIESSNVDAFKVNDILYRAISIIIGPEVEHFYYANTGRNASSLTGSRFRKSTTSNHQIISLQTSFNKLDMKNIDMETSQLSENNRDEIKQSRSKKNSQDSRRKVSSRKNISSAHVKCTVENCLKNDGTKCNKFTPPLEKSENPVCYCSAEKMCGSNITTTTVLEGNEAEEKMEQLRQQNLKGKDAIIVYSYPLMLNNTRKLGVIEEE